MFTWGWWKAFVGAIYAEERCRTNQHFPHRQGSQELLALISVSTPSAAFRRSLHHFFSIWKMGIKINHMLIQLSPGVSVKLFIKHFKHWARSVGFAFIMNFISVSQLNHCWWEDITPTNFAACGIWRCKGTRRQMMKIQGKSNTFKYVQNNSRLFSLWVCPAHCSQLPFLLS